MLAQFHSALDSVECALDIQRKAAQLEGKIRIGIHLGDVTIENQDVFGDGVNIASRLQSIADPGGIYISESTQKAIRARMDIPTQYLGEFQLKNVDYPVRTYSLKGDGLPIPSPDRIKKLTGTQPSRTVILYRVLAFALVVAAATWGIRTLTSFGPAGVESIAVLPFDNLTGNPEQEYLVAGMHNALIGELSQISALRVISKTSTLRFRNSDLSITQIAQELGVDVIVEAAVLGTGDSVHIQVQLIETKPEERSLWSSTYVRVMHNVLIMYSELTAEIARQVEIQMTPREKAILAATQQINPEAYEAYLRGHYHAEQLNRSDAKIALKYFELALEKDPDYAPAYEGIALVWGIHLQNGYLPYNEAMPPLEAAAKRALELDSNLVEVQWILALASTWWKWEWEVAETAFKRAIDLNPNYALAHAYYAHYLDIMGRPQEATIQIELALELDPFNSLLKSLYGMHLNNVDRQEEAISLLREVRKTEPNAPLALSTLVSSLHMKDKGDEAIEAWKQLYTAKRDPQAVEFLLRGYQESGYQMALQRVAEMMEARSDTTYVTPWQIATLYIRAGKKGKALPWLERAYEEHDVNMPYIGVDPIFDELRDEPRFKELLRKMKLS